MILRVEANRKRRITIFRYLAQGFSFRIELRDTKSVGIKIDQNWWFEAMEISQVSISKFLWDY